MNGARIVLGILLLSQTALGRDLYIDPDRGDDHANALAAEAGADGHGPVRTMARGLALAQAGDTVHLAPRTEPYRESILIRNHSGEPGKPIILDGHGATITGCDPLNPADWQQESPGLYKSNTLYGLLQGDDTVIQRMFFLFDGQMQRMNRTSKGAKAPWKNPQELAIGEWTFLPDTQTFYIKVDPAKNLADCGVEVPIRKNGLAVRGQRNEHWIIRDLVVRHVLNDGFNIHQNSKDMRFQNIAAFECGDDGFSAHEGCDCDVDGYRASGNSTGFANGFGSNVKLRNAYLAGNHANEILQMHDSTFDIRDSHVVAGATRPVVVHGNPDKGQVCRGSFDNVLVHCSADRARPFEIGKGAVVTATRLTTIGLSWQIEGEADISQCVIISGGVRAVLNVRPHAVWKGRQNIFDLYSFSFNGASLGSDLQAFQNATAQDADSRQESVSSDVMNRLANREAVFSPCGATLADVKFPDAPP